MTLWNKTPIRYLRLDEHAGYGSSDTKIRQFANLVSDDGPDNIFTHNHGAYGTAGLEITIQKDGNYWFLHQTDSSATENPGISLNSSQLTTAYFSINVNDRLVNTTGTANFIVFGSYCGYFVKGDIIRPHSIPGAVANAVFYRFTATYLGG